MHPDQDLAEPGRTWRWRELRRRQAAWRDALNRFWSHYLFGIDNGAMDGPKAAVQRENGQWVEYADWPVPGSKRRPSNSRPSGDNTVGELGDLTRQASRYHRGRP